MNRAYLAVVAAVAAGSFLVACGKDTPAATCTPAGPELHISVVENHAYDTDCLAAPANTPFRIEFRSEEPTGHDHDVDVSDDDGLVVDGEVIGKGESTTSQGGPLAAGTYTFYCSQHPTIMRGTFIVS